jgi:very-short-patch-repair endonuclease
MQLIRPVQAEGSQEIPDVLVRVKRPKLTQCPSPPNIISSWLLPNWDDPSKNAQIAESQNKVDDQGKTFTVRFDDDPERIESLRAWLDQRHKWATPERAARKAMGFFEIFYDLHSLLEKDGEQLELVAADGHLMWQAESAVDGIVNIQHPILVKRVELRFDPNLPEFAIHETDEASQGDLNALIPLYLGKQIVVVGDHEQVTPLGVGKSQTILDNLRKSMLRDIPNSHLFDNLTSIYDIGRQSFGDGIRLVEHFRCVPEIIAFSNQLSYEGKIRPLRESNSTKIKPACVSRLVDGFRDGNVNQAEAKFIVDRVRSMISHPAYAEKSIGVISMLGEEQALLIQSMLHREIPSTEIERRRIQAGISAEFQGDERDIVFLSMVDSPKEMGPLRMTGDGAFEQTKKRYNVAVSRARDQLWVVHSFDPDLHLKGGDLRLRLLNHVRDPLATIRVFANSVAKAESPFEREVLRRLTDAGFRVTPQWQVGYYRIDMVIEGANKRLALECDGDRYHPLEKLGEDMERQSILERLGWEFVRIRGSAFYRDPDYAMRPVFDRLAELNIRPETNSEETSIPELSTLIHELDELVHEFDEGQKPGLIGRSKSTNDSVLCGDLSEVALA